MENESFLAAHDYGGPRGPVPCPTTSPGRVPHGTGLTPGWLANKMIDVTNPPLTSEGCHAMHHYGAQHDTAWDFGRL